MIEIFEFIFSSFWRWLGMVILLSVALPYNILKIDTRKKEKKDKPKEVTDEPN